MTIKIGETTYAVRKPRNLNKRLEEACGCNAAETARILHGTVTAGQVATALHPFLPDDAPSALELSLAIGAPDADLITSVRKLYEGAIEPDSETEDGADGE